MFNIFGSGPVQNTMLKILINYMRKENVTAIVLRRNDLVTDGDTPGIEVKSYDVPVGVVDGDDDNNFVAECFRIRAEYIDLYERYKSETDEEERFALRKSMSALGTEFSNAVFGKKEVTDAVRID